MRDEADLNKIKAFMERLGSAVKGPGKVYLTGGATALLLGWRKMTIDVDLKGDPEPAGFFESLARLKEELNVNIELASPDLFIPALPDWRERSAFIAKYGAVEFFHFDYYSQALAKLERGHARDLLDVKAMSDRQLIAPKEVFNFFLKIEDELIRFPSIDVTAFRQVVQEFCQSESST